MVLFESLGAVSYLLSIITMALSCIISEIKRSVENRDFLYTSLHSTSPLGGPHWNIAMLFGMEKLEWWGYPM